ncbi:MAG TPA: 2-hydroxyacid dehydrogenase [Candidatus Ruminococcus gallistercoris]|jgi:D-lactate dehydrogenase|nr:2-hydroxyacid dehydrogenase [Acutalibacteraceae bacterium]HJB61053.1 2-hydroxyacid dehydrogenase [Candidatus Ruminococcus gallistercoris]
MKKVAFFDTKPYDRTWFDALGKNYEITYFEEKLNHHTAKFTDGFDAVCAFVNDRVNALAIERLYNNGVQLIAMRCAGYSNVDVKAAFQKLHIVRVPAYSPHAVAEHTMGLLLTLNRRLHKAYNRTREFNFSIVGLTGTDLYGKTVGVIGTGKIGRTFIDICRGFGMRVLAYDKFPAKDSGLDYVELDTLLRESDVISLHCPLTPDTRHILNRDAFSKMKKGVFILNTSRGALIDSEALLDALNSRTVGGAGLDVYEEEANLFYEDRSDTIIHDDTLALLVSRPNVILTAHQAFLTEEALHNIAEETIKNLDAFFSGAPLENEICYLCDRDKAGHDCRKTRRERCF